MCSESQPEDALSAFVERLALLTGRKDSIWWPLELARISPRNGISTLTGTTIGLLLSTSAEEPSVPQLTLQIPTDESRVAAAEIAKSQPEQKRAQKYLVEIDQWIKADHPPVEMAVGTDGGDVRIYLGTLAQSFAPELVGFGRRSSAWYSALSTQSDELLRRLTLSATVRGFAVRFSRKEDASFLLYLVPHIDLTEDGFDYVVEALSPAAASALRDFYSIATRSRSVPAAHYGWGLAVSESGDFVYLKLELAPSVVEGRSRWPNAEVDFDDLARTCRLELIPHVRSFAVGESYRRRALYSRFRPLVTKSTTRGLSVTGAPVSAVAGRREVRAAIDRGLQAVLACQYEDGAWRDFDFPKFGESDAWTTAYVGWQLQSLPKGWRGAGADEASTRAAGFLLRKNRVGWGFNDRMPVDADSTAYALLFLSSLGAPPPPGTVAALAAHQQPDGGFATFLPSTGLPHAWCESHPDVTPIALLALASTRAREGQAIDPLWVPTEPDPLTMHSARLPAFWWNLEWYTVAAWLRLLRHRREKLAYPDSFMDQLRDAEGATVLDQSLLLEAQINLDLSVTANKAALQLLSSQSDSGHWEGGRDLRMMPHNRAVVGDTESSISGTVFVTASAVASLAKFLLMRNLEGGMP